MKRIFLFVATNLAVVLVLGIVASLLGVNKYLTANGLNLGALLGYQPQWTGLTGLDVINATPALDAQPTALLSQSGRTYTRTTFVDFTIRTGSPGSLGPST